MIKTFIDKPLQELFETGKSARIAPELRRRCINRLSLLDKARHVREVTGTGFDTHPLDATDPVRYALSVSGPWRITFEFRNGDAYRVELQQYH